jgi:hypothetical protein
MYKLECEVRRLLCNLFGSTEKNHGKHREELSMFCPRFEWSSIACTLTTLRYRSGFQLNVANASTNSDFGLMFVPCIARLSINNQHCALDYITSLFNMQAPTCFGSSLPDDGRLLPKHVGACILNKEVL